MRPQSRCSLAVLGLAAGLVLGTAGPAGAQVQVRLGWGQGGWGNWACPPGGGTWGGGWGGPLLGGGWNWGGAPLWGAGFPAWGFNNFGWGYPVVFSWGGSIPPWPGFTAPSYGVSDYYANYYAFLDRYTPRRVYVPVAVPVAAARDPEPSPPPRDRDDRGDGRDEERRSPRPPGERFYLDRDPEPEPRREPRLLEPRSSDPLVLARQDLQVTEAEPDLYLVRWAGEPDGIRGVEFRVLQGEAATAERQLSAPPFRALLRVPREATAFHVRVDRRDGSALTLKLPAAELRALARD